MLHLKHEMYSYQKNLEIDWKSFFLYDSHACMQVKPKHKLIFSFNVF